MEKFSAKGLIFNMIMLDMFFLTSLITTPKSLKIKG